MGIVTSAGSPVTMPVNHFRVTPMMVNGWPSIAMLFAGNVRGPAEATLPELVAEHGHRRRSAPAKVHIFRRDQSSQKSAVAPNSE